MALPRRSMDFSTVPRDGPRRRPPERLAPGRAGGGRDVRDRGAAGRPRPAPARLPRADLGSPGRGRALDRRRALAGPPGHRDADRPRPGPRLRARPGALRGGRALRPGAAARRRGPLGSGLARRQPRRPHGDGPALGGASAGSDDREPRRRVAAPARRPRPRPPAPPAARAAAVDRALVRRDAHRAPRARRRRRPALPPLRPGARARLRPPPRRRPLRGRARRAARTALAGRSRTSPAARRSS